MLATLRSGLQQAAEGKGLDMHSSSENDLDKIMIFFAAAHEDMTNRLRPTQLKNFVERNSALIPDHR